MDESQIYDVVAAEIQKRNIVPGIWARAFAEAGGDKEKAQALYIKYRVAQLAADDAARQAGTVPGSPSVGAPAYIRGFNDAFDSTPPPPVISREPLLAAPPKRHGCLWTWLVIMLIFDVVEMIGKVLAPALDSAFQSVSKAAASSGAHVSLPALPAMPPEPAWFIAATIVLCLVDIVAVFGIFAWKRWGFYISVAASVALFVINVVIGTGVFNSLLYLVCPALLYGVLRLGGENCGWRRLK